MAFEYVPVTPEFKNMLEEIFSDEFMQAETRFRTFAGFQYSSAVFVNWKSDILVYNKEVFDNFVKESTNFEFWDEMVHAAALRIFGEKAERIREEAERSPEKIFRCPYEQEES